MADRAGWAPRLALLVAALIVSTGLLEGGFRLYERLFLTHALELEGDVHDLRGLGYNDAVGTLASARAPGEYRILSFGDSFAESSTLAPWTYASALSRVLGRATERSVRVVNFGRNGTSFADYLSQLGIWSERVEHDGVLIGLYAGNDFKEATSMLFVPPGPDAERVLIVPAGPKIPRRYPLRVLDHAYAIALSWRYAGQGGDDRDRYHPRAIQMPEARYREVQLSLVDPYRESRLEGFVHAHFWLWKLLLAAAELERAGVPVAIHLAPAHFAADAAFREKLFAGREAVPEDLDLDLPATVVAALARAAGVRAPLIDLRPCLAEAERRGIEAYWSTNTHWSVEGNQIVAELIAREIAGPWLGRTFEPAREWLATCTTRAPDPRPATRRTLAALVASIEARLAVEDELLAVLSGPAPARPAELAGWLESAGLEHDPERVTGAFWGLLPPERLPIHQLHGLRRPSRPVGWAVDRAAPGEPTSIAFFLDGRLHGLGLTQHPPGERAAWVPGVDADQPNVIFESLVPQLPAVLRRGAFQVVAITASGRFALLPPSSDRPPGLRLP